VWDGDGDFLLIEAAYALPRWARKPEATQHRAFVAAGRLRLLRPALCGESWSLARGLAACAGASLPKAPRLPAHTRAEPAGAQEAAEAAGANERLARAFAGFPQRARLQRHTARARVPARVALLLREEPQLAVRAARSRRSAP